MQVKKEWLTPAILGLAREIQSYKNSDPAPNLGPILADALEEAGCDNEKALKHLREPIWCEIHCQGCWVANNLLDAFHSSARDD